MFQSIQGLTTVVAQQLAVLKIENGVMQTVKYLMIQQLLWLLNKKCPICLPPILTFPNATK